MKRVGYEIPKIDNIIKLLGNVYSDPRDALAEFIVNSLDANSNIIKILVKKGKTNKIIVQDNGIGMNNSEMERVIKNIGNSIKLKPEELTKRNIDAKKVIGHMGIGILGYQSFAKKAKFISKNVDDDNIWSMILESNKTDAIIEKYEDDYTDILIDNHGATVVLENISQDIIRLFNIKFLSQYLQKNFSEILRSRDDIKIYVLDDQNEILIEPLYFSGVEFSKKQIITKSGETISFDIFIQPSGTSDIVSISTKGRVVVKEIITLAEFQKSPWTDDIMHGFINADFLKLTPSRDNYIKDEKYYEFVEALYSIESLLVEEIEKAKENLMSQKREDLIKKLRNAVTKALNELELEGSKMKTLDIYGKLDIGTATNETLPHNLGNGKRKDIHPIINEDQKNETRVKLKGGLNLKWDHLGNPYLHSILKDGGLIIINEDAVDYKNECVSDKREIRYLAKLVSKELSKYNKPYADTDDVMEMSIALEYKILKNLNLL